MWSISSSIRFEWRILANERLSFFSVTHLRRESAKLSLSWNVRYDGCLFSSWRPVCSTEERTAVHTYLSPDERQGLSMTVVDNPPRIVLSVSVS
jgi:hypothetical protein